MSCSLDSWARKPGADPLIFALFVGTALSISALPVITKILIDLNLLRSEMGTVDVLGDVRRSGWMDFVFDNSRQLYSVPSLPDLPSENRPTFRREQRSRSTKL